MQLVQSASVLLSEVNVHLADGRFQHSLALVTGISGMVSGLEVAIEHYHGSFGQRIMYSPLFFCFLLGAVGLISAFSVWTANHVLVWAALFLILNGLTGFAFHIRGVMRKPGGFRQNAWMNLVMGPPFFAPLLLGIAGILGYVASELLPENNPGQLTFEKIDFLRHLLLWSCGVSALLNGFDAYTSHFKTAFSFRSQWIPVCLAPVLAAAAFLLLGFPNPVSERLLIICSIVSVFAGVLGTGFHVRGTVRRMRRGKNWFYKIIYGPPVFAPMLFSASGFFGLLAAGLGR